MSYSTSTRRRPGTSAPGDGSRTITIHDSQPGEDDGSGEGGGSGDHNGGVLRLRGGPKKKSPRRVVWDDDVVDNEGCGRKSSKICCIYHKPKRFDESSDEDSTDTDSDSDCGHAHHHHEQGESSSGGGAQAERSGGSSTTVEQPQYEPNAYEQAPSYKKKGKRRAA
ncbi:phosphatase inhibitor-domain-containing protein [Pterulicium gracile]|uniref:Type 1 phosphatases regulator n=1 Tax=Pterulicium gracile TaxID=1884261 RepID=A0A5C3QCU7_9AGAR|nr:phosphatase inhibitor-domain-containing protein [Pterula gracilis]